MVKSQASCVSLPTNKDKSWLYHEYYIGDRDEEDRKHGTGENHWTRASSMEWYTGHMVRDTMHGLGDYRWRYNGPDCEFVTHEGQFYANQVHGYGVTSYPDGRVFIGLYHTNARWGPGVERYANLLANVGFWRAEQLMRLVWRPSGQSVVPDLTTGNQGPSFVNPFRTVLAKNVKVIGETNLAIELLKQAGADPRVAAKKWTKLYPKNCTDLQSPMCQVDVWARNYYNGKIQFLDEDKLSDGTENKDNEIPDDDEEKNDDASGDAPVISTENFYAWNNSQIMMEIMKHCYMHEKQRKQVNLNLAQILSGHRKRFRPPAEHERDCRTLLMASYLGHIINVAQLVNEHDVHPNIADAQGNTALMYATCGNHEKIIHFLAEAGGDVNYMNDSCCTPLAVALMYYLCTNREIAPKDMLQFLLPKSVDKTKSADENVGEWLISRELNDTHATSNPSSAIKRSSIKKSTKSVVAVIKQANNEEYDSDNSFHEEKRLYTTITQEYEIRMHNLFSQRTAAATQYIFDVRNIVEDALLFDSTDTLTAANTKLKKEQSKIVNISKEASMMNNNEKEDTMDNYDKIKQELLSKIMLTILQLLSDGADPRLVKCPKPALFLAVSSGNPDLIRHLFNYGADINEVYPETLNYTALDVAVALPFTNQNTELIRALLECGANPNHRLQMPADKSEIPGPTLLHAVIARKIESELEEEVRNQVFQLLLRYNCDPFTTFNGCSAIDNAMSKNLDLLDLIIKSPVKIDFNQIINDNHQTILVKLFTASYFVAAHCSDRFLTLTNLLLYGADPLIECQNGDATYENVYEFAKKTLYEDFGYRPMVSAKTSPTSPDLAKRNQSKGSIKKGKSVSKTVQQDKVKPSLKCSDENIRDYIEALQLMTHCGRMLHVRWIQSKLMRELVDIIKKYKHRHWNMIIKEHKNKECCALWLTAQRCLEMWDIFKQTRISVYHDDIVLKHLLCIVQFYNKRSSCSKIKYPATAIEKDAVDSFVSSLVAEHKALKMMEIVEEWKKKYVKPELCSIHDPKFDICFNCALPLKFIEDNTLCSRCKLVWFCSLDCMKINVQLDDNCHPCSKYLIRKYFACPSPTTDRSVEVCV